MDLNHRPPRYKRGALTTELWELDTIVRFDLGIKRYIITAKDIYSKYAFALAYRRANSQNTRDFFQKLEQVAPFQIKHIQTDNGGEFHKYFADYIEKSETIHFWNYKSKPYLNGHIERFNRSIQDEFIDWNEQYLADTEKFNQKLVDWLIWYNTKRPHWSLRLQQEGKKAKMVSPVDFLINNSFLSRMCWTGTAH